MAVGAPPEVPARRGEVGAVTRIAPLSAFDDHGDRKGYNAGMRKRLMTGNRQLWTVVWLFICALIGDLFAERHFVLAVAALAGVVWACIRWTRPATVTEKH